MFFLSLYRSEFLTCIIFLVTKELLLMFLTTHVYWQQIPSVFICLRNSLSNQEFFKTMKNMLRALMDKVDNMQE